MCVCRGVCRDVRVRVWAELRGSRKPPPPFYISLFLYLSPCFPSSLPKNMQIYSRELGVSAAVTLGGWVYPLLRH